MDENVILTMRGITKSFPGVLALDNASLKLRKGEIHALMGENGAGKSTLIKVLTGIYPFEGGEIEMEGVEGQAINHSVQEAQERGIATVYQEVNLCPNLSVAENLFIGREPRTKCNTIDWKKMNSSAREIMKNLDIPVDVTMNLENYSVAIQQMVAIARAVDMECRILILDEPTSSLDDNEVEKLFRLMRDLKNKGVAILFVTHFLEQVYAVCDRITVLRNGQFAGEYTVAEMPRVKLVAAMLGKDLDDLASIKAEGSDTVRKDVVVDAKGLSHKGTIKPFDFVIHKGEVVGLTGLLGSGRSEMARCIYGADRAQTGTLTMNGKELKAKAPIDSINAGMGYLPDDRKADGLIGDLSVKENIYLALQARKGMFHPLSPSEQNALADKFIELLQIKTASRETPVNQLSGGNQQKVILARWLATDPELLILDEPTRGIDIGTKTEIQKLILKLAAEGKSVIFISSEIEEMLRTCSRLCVMRDGSKVGELDHDLTQNTVMTAIAGQGKEGEQ
ncbi:MAG: sugar ABC transporter ATP-binding protein [Lachnospiraceae bacterium]|jgi:monosaccharide-transporting ATPase|nr:sugar ABC transporter ATP-binding protein [Lachnospiraceae bacterium]